MRSFKKNKQAETSSSYRVKLSSGHLEIFDKEKKMSYSAGLDWAQQKNSTEHGSLGTAVPSLRFNRVAGFLYYKFKN